MVIRVSVASLKAELSKYLNFARRGEAVVVTSHGQEIAKISPLQGANDNPVNWKLFFAKNKPIKIKNIGTPVSKILLDMRDEE